MASPYQVLWRATIVAACLAMAGLAVVSGLDSGSRTRVALARLVPWPFAYNAALARGRTALGARHYADVEQAAVAAVRAAPTDPESTALLGAARAGLDDAAGAERAFLVAGRLGWRTPVTQFYWMQRALEVGDSRVAALRLDAILRVDPALAGNRGLLAPLEANEAGRAALAERLFAAPDWLRFYANDVTKLEVPDAEIRANVFNRLAAAGRPLGCPEAGTLTTQLINLGRVSVAYRFWRQHCPQRAGGLLSDSGLDNLQVHRPDSPFDWTVIGDSDVSLSVDTAAGGQRRLLLASSASFPRKMMNQLSVLAPGNYRLSWSAVNAGGADTSRIAATVSCDADSHDWLPAVRDEARHRFVVDFAVDDSCPARWVGFAILPGADSVSFGAIALQRR